jgi:GNAT superfamily N-acetyltransferase
MAGSSLCGHLMEPRPFHVRLARPDELAALGNLVADAYAALPGMPGPEEQPGYYAMVRDAAARTRNPAIRVLAAVTPGGELLGSADFIEDMAHYGSGGTASTRINAAGIRLLAVAPTARGQGIGKALTRHCIEQVGFRRSPDLDFRQGNLEVFGFELYGANLQTDVVEPPAV